MRIRAARLSDLDPLTELIGRANATYRGWAGEDWSSPAADRERQHWLEQIGDPDGWAAVAETDRGLIGCVNFSATEAPTSRWAHLSRLFVDPGAWRAGIGTALCTEAIAEMRRRGFDRAYLFAAAANSGARSFYERHGWQAAEQTREWHGLRLLRYTLDPLP